MEQMPYSINGSGIALPLIEIWTPDSELDLSNKYNFNLHHLEFERRSFGRCILLQTVRDIATNQCRVPLDVHEYINRKYTPPELPTPQQALYEVERARDAGEVLNIRKKKGGYIKVEMSDLIMKQCCKDYMRFKNSRSWN